MNENEVISMKRVVLAMGVVLLLTAGSALAGEPNGTIFSQPEFWGPAFQPAPVHGVRWTAALQQKKEPLVKTKIIRKSPKKALLFSALMPGAGELYAESWLKAGFFAAVEVGAWVSYVHYQKKGMDLEDQFKAYADRNWSKERWDAWYSGLPDEAKSAFSHTLPSTKTQQYYEMIGKYMEFNAGWIDVKNPDPDIARQDTSKMSLYYMALRERSNRALKAATAMTGVVLANHVISALDAAWTARVFKKEIKQKIEIEYIYLNEFPVFMAQLKTEW
jgi:hypothetical protein